MEKLKQAHRQSHAHVHLTEVNEDRHQHDRVWWQVMELKAIVLQWREEEGGERECKPSQGIRGEEDELTGPQAAEQNGSALHPPVVLRQLPS
jgi:hypothetical protein